MESERSYKETRRDAVKQERWNPMRARLENPPGTLRDETYERFQAACVHFILMLFFASDRKSQHTGTGPFDPFSQGLPWNMTGGSGGSYMEYHYHEESETTSFSTTGTVVTEDGREIEFGLHVSMSRSFVEESSLKIEYGVPQYCDPLVIHLDDAPGRIPDATFSFDIDADGTEDTINRLGTGSGFLALDENEDGIIHDGSELFGAKSGNGFRDLARFDEDGNGWIDENDAVFQKLKIWTKDECGRDRLLSLKEADVGAIFLGSVDTDFSIKNAANETQARIRCSGFFLRESDGLAGAVTQLDLVRHEAEPPRPPAMDTIAGRYEANLAYA